MSWNLPYPLTISYRTLGADPQIRCNQSDYAFDQQVAAEHLDGYEVYMIEGARGTCPRIKGEQMKRLHPNKMVLDKITPTAASPVTWPGGAWAGYYLLMNRTTALSTVDATQTQVDVANPAFFSVGDTTVMWSPTPSDPYANSEWVTVTAINNSTLTVTRDIFGTGVRTYATPPLIAAAATGSGYPLPMYNFADMAPINPANRMRAKTWLANAIAADFAPSVAGGTTLDGIELDSSSSTPPAQNTNGAVKNFDCNGDGIIDYCQKRVGTNQQVDSYGVGYDEFLQVLKRQLAQYDTDASRPQKILIADGEMGLRSVGTLDGAEFESFPSWDDYTTSSGALSSLGVWQNNAGAAGSHFSYEFTKDATPLYPQAGCGGPYDSWCRNASYRYGMAAALTVGAGSSYNNEANFSTPQGWDEEATVNQATTGLAPGYLGVPLGPAVRTLSYASGQLAVNGDFETDLSGTTTNTAVPSGITITRDTTTAAPGSGSASLRADVNGLTASPVLRDTRVSAALSAPVVPGEYTVDFWAKAQSTTLGPAALNLGVSLDGASGAAQKILATPTWTHYYIDFATATAVARANVRFVVGTGVGHYWIDGLSVHQGTAGVVTREFTNGIVVVNDSFATQANIPLPGGPYHHINGVQDRTVNDGSSVGSVLPSIAAKDGVILLRG